VRNAKAKDKPYKLADGGGLYLEVMPSGGKLWRMKFRQADGKENRLAFGAFPDVSLVDARAKRDEARQLLAAGTDPARARAEQARQARLTEQNTFEHVARNPDAETDDELHLRHEKPRDERTLRQGGRHGGRTRAHLRVHVWRARRAGRPQDD
jgi:hypothetical protein